MIDGPTPLNPLEMPPPQLRARQGYAPLWGGQGVHELLFVLLEQSIHWYGVHVIDQRPQPCLLATGRCLSCATGWLPRRTGYICALRHVTGGRYLLRITAYAFRLCPVLALPSGLRGVPLWVSRRGDGPQAPWNLKVAVGHKINPDLPPSVDTVSVLSMLWGVDLRKLAQCPPPNGDIAGELQPYHPKKQRRQK